MTKKGYKQSEEHKRNLSISHLKEPCESYKKWLENGKPKIFCQCGCNKEIIINNSHRWNGIPNYISGHNTYIHNPMNNIESRNKLRNVIFSEERCKRISESQKGKHHSESTKEKMRIKKLGICRSDETKQKISNNAKDNENYGMKNKHHTEESKKKMSKNLIGKCAGKNHYNWHGGISFEPYCPKFNEPTKRKIRERDGYICQMPGCLCTQLESLLLYNHSLNIHHVHYDKPNCNPDLITLCHSCNTIVNYNRDYWEKLFTNILNKRI